MNLLRTVMVDFKSSQLRGLPKIPPSSTSPSILRLLVRRNDMARKLFGFQQLRNALRTLGYILFMYLFSISSVDVLQQMVFAGVLLIL